MVFSVRLLQALLVGGLAQIALAEDSSWKEQRLEAYVNYVFVIFAVAIALVLLWRIPSTWIRHRRQKCSVNDAPSQSSTISAAFKKHVLYAPIFRRRKNRAMVVKPSSNINLGTLPTRLEALFILAYVGTNMLCMFNDIDYTAKTGPLLYVIRNRSGAVATANMVCMTCSYSDKTSNDVVESQFVSDCSAKPDPFVPNRHSKQPPHQAARHVL